MQDELLFQSRVAGVTLEIISENGDARATVTYPYPDPRFERGGFPTVVWVLRELGSRLSKRDHLRSLFLAELVPCGSEETPPEAPLPLDDLFDWLEAQRQGVVGSLEPTRGFWLSASDGLADLVRLAQPLQEASAEASRARLLLLDGEARGARGWDLCHADGITTLGRWRLELGEEPAPLDPEDLDPTRELLEALASVISPRLANGKGH